MIDSYINSILNIIKSAHENPSIHSPSPKGSENTQGERFILTLDPISTTDNNNQNKILESKMETTTQDLGLHGEEKVAQWLKAKGFAIKEMNYRQRCGEIDIIALKDDLLAFVEVKLRTHAYFNLSEVITPSKQAKIIRTAMIYIMENNIANKIYRFDVALLEKQTDKYKLTYLPNAFTQKTY